MFFTLYRLLYCICCLHHRWRRWQLTQWIDHKYCALYALTHFTVKLTIFILCVVFRHPSIPIAPFRWRLSNAFSECRHSIRCSKSLISIDNNNVAADTVPPLIIRRKSLHRCNGLGCHWDVMHSIRAPTICWITSMTTTTFIIKI